MILPIGHSNAEKAVQDTADVAQVSNLPCRRFPIGRASAIPGAQHDLQDLQAGSPAIQQVGNLRYERPAFTLIEVVLVMALLAISAFIVAPASGSLFRGRALV